MKWFRTTTLAVQPPAAPSNLATTRRYAAPPTPPTSAKRPRDRRPIDLRHPAPRPSSRLMPTPTPSSNSEPQPAHHRHPPQQSYAALGTELSIGASNYANLASSRRKPARRLATAVPRTLNHRRPTDVESPPKRSMPAKPSGAPTHHSRRRQITTQRPRTSTAPRLESHPNQRPANPPAPARDR
jgi:hypothetical protein